jgi:hypothetical protein
LHLTAVQLAGWDFSPQTRLNNSNVLKAYLGADILSDLYYQEAPVVHVVSTGGSGSGKSRATNDVPVSFKQGYYGTFAQIRKLVQAIGLPDLSTAMERLISAEDVVHAAYSVSLAGLDRFNKNVFLPEVARLGINAVQLAGLGQHFTSQEARELQDNLRVRRLESFLRRNSLNAEREPGARRCVQGPGPV